MILGIDWKCFFKLNKEDSYAKFYFKDKMVTENLVSPNFDLVYIKIPLCNQIQEFSWDFILGDFCIYGYYLIAKLFSDTEKVCFQMFLDNIWIRNCKNQTHTKCITYELK